jgi:hypothetical protein
MANEFKVRKGLVINGSGSVLLDIQGSQGQLFSVTDQLSGSLFSVSDISGIPVMEAFSDNTVKIGKYGSEAIKVSGSVASITGSLFGTSSQAITASYLLGGVSAQAFPYSGSAQITGSLGVTGSLNVSGSITTTGTITAQTLVVQTITSSIEYSSGSNIFGSRLTDTQTMTGSVNITGSLSIIGGNVGIGTTSPTSKLDVNGTLGLSGYLFAQKSGNYNILYDPAGGAAIYLGNASDPGNYYDNTSHNFRSRGGSTNYVTINSSGNVGIGLTNPSALLHISGSGSGSLFQISSTVSSSIFFVSGSGNVGIGTTTPSTSLDVSGSGRFTNSLSITGSAQITGSLRVTGSISASGSIGAAVFSSNADSLVITGSLNLTGSFTQVGYQILTAVSQSYNYTSDANAAAGGIPLGGLYRNGNAIQIRLA